MIAIQDSRALASKILSRLTTDGNQLNLKKTISMTASIVDHVDSVNYDSLAAVLDVDNDGAVGIDDLDAVVKRYFCGHGASHVDVNVKIDDLILARSPRSLPSPRVSKSIPRREMEEVKTSAIQLENNPFDRNTNYQQSTTSQRYTYTSTIYEKEPRKSQDQLARSSQYSHTESYQPHIVAPIQTSYQGGGAQSYLSPQIVSQQAPVRQQSPGRQSQIPIQNVNQYHLTAQSPQYGGQSQMTPEASNYIRSSQHALSGLHLQQSRHTPADSFTYTNSSVITQTGQRKSHGYQAASTKESRAQDLLNRYDTKGYIMTDDVPQIIGEIYKIMDLGFEPTNDDIANYVNMLDFEKKGFVTRVDFQELVINSMTKEDA